MADVKEKQECLWYKDGVCLQNSELCGGKYCLQKEDDDYPIPANPK